jgi:hypothetical protein
VREQQGAGDGSALGSARKKRPSAVPIITSRAPPLPRPMLTLSCLGQHDWTQLTSLDLVYLTYISDHHGLLLCALI